MRCISEAVEEGPVSYQELKMNCLVKLYWLLNTWTMVSALAITLLFWSIIYDPSKGNKNECMSIC